MEQKGVTAGGQQLRSVVLPRVQLIRQNDAMENLFVALKY